MRCPNFAGAVSDGYIFTVNADGIELSPVGIEQLTDNKGTCQIPSSAEAGPTKSGDNGTRLCNVILGPSQYDGKVPI